MAFSYDCDTTMSQYLPGWLPTHLPYTPRWHSSMTVIPPCPSTSRDGYPLTSLHPMVAFSHDYDTTMSQYLRRWLPPYHPYTPRWHSPMTMIPPCPSTSRDGYPLTSLHPMVAFSHDYDTTMSQYLLRWLPPYHPYTPRWHSPMTVIPPCPSTSRDGYPPTIPTPQGGILP